VIRQIILVLEAQEDLNDAFRWYEERELGLGNAFVICLESAFRQIALNPRQYPIRFENFRRILTHGFPFAVYFDYDDKCVYIYYIFHCSRNPERLKKRLKRIG
jgi:toxin ParE1/3/4